MLNSMWGKFGQQFNKTLVKEFVNQVTFHNFLDSDKHEIRYVSSFTEERVEEYYKQQEEGRQAITEPEHICRLLLHLLRPITLLGDILIEFKD